MTTAARWPVCPDDLASFDEPTPLDAPLLDAKLQRLTDDCREVFELTLRHEDGSRVRHGERSRLLAAYAGLLLRLAGRDEVTW